MKHILFYPKTDSILPRSSTEEALKRVETYLPKSKLKSFDNLIVDVSIGENISYSFASNIK